LKFGFLNFLSYIQGKNMGRRLKKFVEPKVPEFIVLNEYCQVFCGCKGGYPAFSDNIEDAKPLVRDSQVRTIQQGTSFKLEKEYL
jgi:tRNA U54 and U55 pseudouridine synthase Pus10